MKVLQLCKKFPYPIKDGEVIAINHLSSALNALGAEVTLLCMNTPKHFFDQRKVPSSFNSYQAIHVVEVDTKVKPTAAFLNLFSKRSYHIERFHSVAYSRKLKELLQEQTFDVVQLETLYLAPYIPVIRKNSKAIIAMRAHNVEHEIWQRITRNTQFFPKRWYLNLLTKRLRKYEIEQLRNYDILLPITQRDLDLVTSLGFRQKALVVPIGLSAANYAPDPGNYDKALSLSFIGSLDWMPNLEGLNWFLKEVWENIQQQFPEVTLHLAGRNTPDWLYDLQNENLKVYGEIPDAQVFINAHSLMLVPLLSGSGMRVKILEGMALGKVVLTTSIGLEGINAKHKEQVLIADTPKAFLAAIRFCKENPQALRQIGQKARQLIIEEYDNMTIARKLAELYMQNDLHDDDISFER